MMLAPRCWALPDFLSSAARVLCQERAGHVDGENPVPVFKRGVLDRVFDLDARRIDQNIELVPAASQIIEVLMIRASSVTSNAITSFPSTVSPIAILP